ncbi:MAG: hypothetical protein HWD59_05430 [Coxiellaceae bacterium]|nr:MAG: hypothetical protein HWD59_05430 [Coxiellaceae bacterium]
MLIHVDYKKNFDWEARLVSFDDNVYVIMAGGNTEDNTSLNNLINIIAYLGGISHKHGINFHFKEQFIIKTNKATHDDYKEFYIGRLNIQSELLTKNHFYRPFESKSSIQSQKPSPGIQSKLKMSAADLEAIMYELLSGNIRKVFACLPNLEDFYSLYNEYLLSDEVCENYLQDKADTLPQNSLIDFGFNCKDHSLVRIPLSFGVANKFSTRTLRLHDHLNNGYIEVFNGNENCKFIYVSSEIVNEFIKYLVNTNDITEIHINKGIGIKKLMGLYRKNLQNELFMPKPGKNKNYQTHQKTAEECANAGKKHTQTMSIKLH